MIGEVMRKMARNKESGYLFPLIEELEDRPDFETVEIPDDMLAERTDDYGNPIGHNDNPRDDTSDGEIIEEIPAPKKVARKKKVAKKKAIPKRIEDEKVVDNSELIAGID